MMLKESIIYQATDGCKFAGCLYQNENKNKTIAIFVHGSNGNFYKLKYTDEIGKELLKRNIDFLSADNRGREQYVTNYKVINGVKNKIKIGTMYEDFNESELDIEGMIQFVKERKYENIILIGESLGSLKVLNYCQQHNDINKIIILSPVDMILRFKNRVKDDYDTYIEKAKQLVNTNQPYEMVTEEYSALKVASTMAYNIPADILRLEENRTEYTLNYQGKVFVIVGTDDHCSKDLGKEYLNKKLSERFKNATYNFCTIENANHTFQNNEMQLAQMIANAIQDMLK